MYCSMYFGPEALDAIKLLLLLYTRISDKYFRFRTEGKRNLKRKAQPVQLFGLFLEHASCCDRNIKNKQCLFLL